MALNRKKRKHGLGECVGANLQIWITFFDRVVKASSLNSNLNKEGKAITDGEALLSSSKVGNTENKYFLPPPHTGWSVPAVC